MTWSARSVTQASKNASFLPHWFIQSQKEHWAYARIEQHLREELLAWSGKMKPQKAAALLQQFDSLVSDVYHFYMDVYRKALH